MKEIPLTKGQVVIVDDSDYDYLNQWKWYAQQGSNGVYYAVRKPNIDGRKDMFYMHRVITDAPRDKSVDHINKNGLDNRRCNLRLCTSSENLHNGRKPISAKTSMFKGVYWHKCAKKWQSAITVSRRVIYLGLFTSEHNAAVAYDLAAIKYFGKFASLNFKGEVE